MVRVLWDMNPLKKEDFRFDIDLRQRKLWT